jgi:aryl-alcohol dehydrogenase-like predicted oxidoreductase
MGKEPEDIRNEIEETRARMGDTVEALGYKTDVKSRTKDSISNAKENVVGKVSGVRDSIVGSASSARDSVSSSTPDAQQLKQNARKAASVAQRNPLGLALGSVALGFLAGLSVPSTQMEDERLGPVADQVKDKVKETSQEALDRGKQVAQEVGQTAAQSAQDAAQRVAETAKQSGQEQGQELASSAQAKAQEVSPNQS